MVCYRFIFDSYAGVHLVLIDQMASVRLCSAADLLVYSTVSSWRLYNAPVMHVPFRRT